MSAFRKLYSLSTLKISREFESDPQISRKKWNGAREERDLSYVILQVVAKLLELFSYLDFRQLAEIHIIRLRVFLCKAFLFYQVHFTSPQPRLIAPAMPQEIGWQFAEELETGVSTGGVSPGAWGLLTECLGGLIWEASFYLISSSFRFCGPLGSDGRPSCHTIFFLS